MSAAGGVVLAIVVARKFAKKSAILQMLVEEFSMTSPEQK